MNFLSVKLLSKISRKNALFTCCLFHNGVQSSLAEDVKNKLNINQWLGIQQVIAGTICHLTGPFSLCRVFFCSKHLRWGLFCVCLFKVEAVRDRWTGCCPLSAWVFLPGNGPPASVNLSLRCSSPPNEPSTQRVAHRGTMSMEHSPKRPSSLVENCRHTVYVQICFIKITFS